MALCVSDGLEIDGDPTYAVYAWDAFEDQPLEAMALHPDCFLAGEWIDAAWWENDPETNEPILRMERQLRLYEVPGPGLWQRTAEGDWVQVIARAVARG
jgi:hypothetical protein